MIGRPTTEQIARDCARELLETVLPSVEGDNAQVTVRMLENVLRNIAVRAAHEIAWMTEEIAVMVGYAEDVTAALEAGAVDDALGRYREGPRDSLHLDDVVENYARAGDAFSAALEAALAAGDDARSRRANEILHERCEHEVEAMAEWSPIGR